MADRIPVPRDSFGVLGNCLRRDAGGLTGRKSPPPIIAAPATRAAKGSGAPEKEARDTVAGCRDRAADDRLQAAGADTENRRRVFERSAGCWDRRAEEIQDGGDASAQQRAADRDLWASEE